MAFKGITFAGQNVTPKNDGALYNAHYGDGILDGCTMTISGDDLVIASGHFIAGGRVCQVDGATSVDLSGRTLTTGYIQVIMNYDLSQGEGSQWYTTFVESATTTFPDLTQDDINGTGTLYQLELAVIQISGGNLTSITSQIAYSPIQILDANGDMVGKVDYDGSDMVDFCRTDADGNPLTGVFANENDVCVYANNRNIVFRPKGRDDNTNQVAISAAGQIYNGYTIEAEDDDATSHTGTAGNYGIAFKVLPAGLHAIQFEIIFTPNSAGVFANLISIGSSATGDVGKDAIYCGNTAGYAITTTALLRLTSATTIGFHFYASTTYNRQRTKINIYRIG